jgi:hypothetical protein
MKKACVAVARKLAIIMHRMWLDDRISNTAGNQLLPLPGEGFRVATLFCRGRADGQSVSIAVLHGVHASARC